MLQGLVVGIGAKRGDKMLVSHMVCFLRLPTYLLSQKFECLCDLSVYAF